MPALLHFYGLKPWELDDCTYGELHRLVEALPKEDGDGSRP